MINGEVDHRSACFRAKYDTTHVEIFQCLFLKDHSFRSIIAQYTTY